MSWRRFARSPSRAAALLSKRSIAGSPRPSRRCPVTSSDRVRRTGPSISEARRGGRQTRDRSQGPGVDFLYLGHHRRAQGRDADSREFHRRGIDARRASSRSTKTSWCFRCCRCITPSNSPAGCCCRCERIERSRIQLASMPKNLSRTLADLRPTALIGVPALWEAIHRRILDEIESRGPFFHAAFNQLARAQPAPAFAIRESIWARCCFRQAHSALGGRLKLAVSGGAALPEAGRGILQRHRHAAARRLRTHRGRAGA